MPKLRSYLLPMKPLESSAMTAATGWMSWTRPTDWPAYKAKASISPVAPCIGAGTS